MAEFSSSGRFAVLGDPPAEESSEKKDDLGKVQETSRKAGKKKKKKKQQGQKPSEAVKEVAPTSKQHFETAVQYHSDHQKASLELDNKEQQLETRQDANFESSQARPLSVGTHPSNVTETAMGQTTPYSEATANTEKSGKKKKKKKKGPAKRGILPSELNFTSSKPIDKGTEMYQEVDEEDPCTKVLQSESNTSTTLPNEAQPNKVQNEMPKDEDCGRTGTLLSQSNVPLPKPSSEERTQNEDGEEIFETQQEAVLETSSRGETLTDLERFSSERTLLTQDERER